MRYLGLALFAEGPTDYRFLSPLLTRAVAEICLAHGQTRLDISDVIPLDTPELYREDRRSTRIREAARAAWGSFHLLFVHSDGWNDPDRVREEQTCPGMREVAELAADDVYEGIAVVPVRETEAWALCDGDALRAAFQTTLADEDLYVPQRARDAERLLDPKATLELAYTNVLGGSGRKRGRTSASFLTLIAETIDLGTLRELPSFKRLHDDMETALKNMHVLR